MCFHADFYLFFRAILIPILTYFIIVDPAVGVLAKIIVVMFLFFSFKMCANILNIICIYNKREAEMREKQIEFNWFCQDN